MLNRICGLFAEAITTQLYFVVVVARCYFLMHFELSCLNWDACCHFNVVFKGFQVKNFIATSNDFAPWFISFSLHSYRCSVRACVVIREVNFAFVAS